MSRLETVLGDLPVYCASHRCDDAIAALEEAIRIEPQCVEARFRLGMCYSGGCHTHALCDVEIAVEHFRGALARQGASQEPLLRARILGALANTYCRSSRLPPKARLLTAISCCEEAAAIYRRYGELADWAREQHNLGNAWCDLPEEEFPGKWRRAIACYESALSVRTAEAEPTAHAATLQNLGTAWRELPTGNRTANVARAIHCYRRALRFYRAAASPLKNAALHNNLGNAYLTLPAATEERRKRNAARALRHFDRALAVRTRERSPGDYAATQFNRGNALLHLAAGGCSALEHLEKSLVCFCEAEQCLIECGEDRLAEAAGERARRIEGMLRAGHA